MPCHRLDAPRGALLTATMSEYGVVGDTREEVDRLIRDAIGLHLDGLRDAGEPIPPPAALDTTLIEVPAA